MNEVSAAFGELDDDEFEDRYDFSRPEKDLKSSPIVITCRSGVRATKAAETMRNLGFPVAIYKGSLLDWIEKGGKVEPKFFLKFAQAGGGGANMGSFGEFFIL